MYFLFFCVNFYYRKKEKKRRSEIIRTVKTLDQLTEALNREGYSSKRSSVYLRLLPRNSLTKEGGRHITTAPVKLISAKNSKHQNHPCTNFAKATINALEELAGLLGPREVTFHSQDDKAKVPIGITAASKQAPLLMHMEYKVILPNHDYAMASQYNLIPSVIRDMQVRENDFSGDAATYSGPTYCAIRSATHFGSSAYHHLQDMKRIPSLYIFDGSFKNNGEAKPVMTVMVDKSPDENPRYPKTIEFSIDYFLSQDLDAFFLATNAPGRGAFNRVERRMVKFSQELRGVVLLHDNFGSHLNAKGETIDKELENRNFGYAEEILAKIWSGMIIDGHPVLAEFIGEEADQEVIKKSEKWKSKHVRESQYFLQIVKCKDSKCCSPFRSSYLKIVKDRFLPLPISVTRTTGSGLKWVKRDVDAHYLSLTQNLALKARLGVTALKSFPKGIPYDCVLNVDCILHQLKKCLCMNRCPKSRRQLHLILPLKHQVSNRPKQFNLHA